jgi:hypothetical protein
MLVLLGEVGRKRRGDIIGGCIKRKKSKERKRKREKVNKTTFKPMFVSLFSSFF